MIETSKKTRGGHHPRYTKDEFQALRQAILTGRGEGKDDKAIAESLVKNDIFPGRTAKALGLQMSRMLPKYSKAAGNGRYAYVKVKPGKMRKVSTGSGAYGRLQRLLTRREELIAERATVEAEIKEHRGLKAAVFLLEESAPTPHSSWALKPRYSADSSIKATIKTM